MITVLLTFLSLILILCITHKNKKLHVTTRIYQSHKLPFNSQNSTKSLMKSAPSVTLFHVFCPVVKSQKINSNTLSISTMIRYRVQDILSPFRLTSPLPGPNSRCWLSHSHHTNDRLAWHVKWKNGSAFPCHCWTPLPKPSGGRGWLFEKWDLYTDSSRDRGKVVQRNP